jgi:hypothetical protein
MGTACSTYEKGIHAGFWLEIQKERDYYENLDVGERII